MDKIGNLSIDQTDKLEKGPTQVSTNAGDGHQLDQLTGQQADLQQDDGQPSLPAASLPVHESECISFQDDQFALQLFELFLKLFQVRLIAKSAQETIEVAKDESGVQTFSTRPSTRVLIDGHLDQDAVVERRLQLRVVDDLNALNAPGADQIALGSHFERECIPLLLHDLESGWKKMV